MRHPVLSLLLLVLIVPAASATETVPSEVVVPEVVPTVVVETPAEVDLRLLEVDLEERAVEEDASAIQSQPPRGSFWWMVGVIVVAGVILALVL